MKLSEFLKRNNSLEIFKQECINQNFKGIADLDSSFNWGKSKYPKKWELLFEKWNNSKAKIKEFDIII